MVILLRFIKRHSIIEEITKEPKKVYEILGIDPVKDIINNSQIVKYIC